MSTDFLGGAFIAHPSTSVSRSADKTIIVELIHIAPPLQ
jgi:hypothetical protein